jgi:hypothetical protein
MESMRRKLLQTQAKVRFVVIYDAILVPKGSGDTTVMMIYRV